MTGRPLAPPAPVGLEHVRVAPICLANVGLALAFALFATPAAHAQAQVPTGAAAAATAPASPPSSAALPAPGPKPAAPLATVPQGATAQAATDAAPPDDPAADLAQLRDLYQATCGARAYGAYDDMCEDLGQKVRDAERAARRARH